MAKKKFGQISTNFLQISGRERDSRGATLWSTAVAEPHTVGLKLPTSGWVLSLAWQVQPEVLQVENGALQEAKGNVSDSFRAGDCTGEHCRRQVGCRETDLGLMSPGNQKGPRSKASREATGLGGRSPGQGMSSPRTLSWARGRPAHPARALPVA